MTLTVSGPDFNSGPTSALPKSGSYAVQDRPGGFVLSVPMTDGSVRPYPFHSSSISDYNADIQKMNSPIQPTVGRVSRLL